MLRVVAAREPGWFAKGCVEMGGGRAGLIFSGLDGRLARLGEVFAGWAGGGMTKPSEAVRIVLCGLCSGREAWAGGTVREGTPPGKLRCDY